MEGRFIISTGRSGSTLLSRALAENRRLLVLSEFLSSLDNGRRFGDDAIEGREFLDILSADDDVSALIAARGRPSAEALHGGRPSDRTATGRAPSLVRACLPMLADDPDALFERIASEVVRWPGRTRRGHFEALFAWLCGELGRDAWVERSGFGIRLFPELRRTFPRARFLHLHRDGREAALSMYHHPWFRVGVHLDFQSPGPNAIDTAIRSPQAGTDFVTSLFETPPSLALYGEHWSNLLARAFADFVHLDAEQYRDLWFEHLIEAPERALREVAAFLELPKDPGWIERGAALIAGSVARRFDRLEQAEREKLAAACRPGQILVGRERPGRLDQSLAEIRAGFLRARESAAAEAGR